MQLQSRKKWTVNGTSRIRPAQETLEKVVPISKRIGVTRLADITDMDVLRIPNYSAVVPGTEDYIWVYSGKGPTSCYQSRSAGSGCCGKGNRLAGSCVDSSSCWSWTRFVQLMVCAMYSNLREIVLVYGSPRN